MGDHDLGRQIEVRKNKTARRDDRGAVFQINKVIIASFRYVRRTNAAFEGTPFESRINTM